MTGATPPRIDRATTVVAAPPDAVFAAWSDPLAVAQWLPPGDARGTIEQFEFRTGGRFRMILDFRPPVADAKSGPDRDVVEARFVQIEPPHRLVLAVDFDSPDPRFGGTMRMDWRFSPEAPGTRVALACHDVPIGISPDDHAAGLGASLAQLARFVETPS